MDKINIAMIISVALLYLLLVGRTAMLMRQGIKPFVLGKEKKGINRLIEISFLIGLVIWSSETIFNSLHIKYHFSPDIFNNYLFNIAIFKVIGIILIFVGTIIFISALISFGKSWRIGIDKNNAGKLITKGIFSITRNPIFLYINIYFLGTFLVYSNLFFLITMILVFIGVHFQILQEEKFLLSYYGNEYREYIRKVRRYI